MPISQRPYGNSLEPANTRAVDSARRTLQNVVAQVQQRNLNALAVQGTPIVLFRQLEAGQVCSCSQHGNEKAEDPLSEDGRATQEHLNSILHGGGFGIIKYDEVQSPTGEVTKTGRVDLDWREPSPNGEGGVLVADDDLTDDFDLQAQINAGMQGFTCSCCFGTGIVGGYDIVGGKRLVLTAPTGGQFTTDLEGRPDAYESIEGAHWSLRIPRNFLTALDIKLYHGKTLLEAGSYKLTVGGLPLTVANVKLYATGQPIQIDIDNGQVFTHLEITYLTTRNLPRVDLGAVNDAVDVNLFDGTREISVTFGPDVPNVKAGYLFADTLHGKLWRVTGDVERTADGFNNTYGWQAAARAVQTHELHYLLGLRHLVQNWRPIVNLERRK